MNLRSQILWATFTSMFFGCAAPTSQPVGLSRQLQSVPPGQSDGIEFVDLKQLHVIAQLPPPRYSPEARAAGIQGTVIVELLVDETGKVASAKAVSGPVELWSMAEQTAKNFTFMPYSPVGTPRKVRSRLTCVYNLR